MKTSTSAMGS